MSESNYSRTRRQFIGGAVTTVAATSGLSVMPTTAEAMRRVQGANKRIGIGFIGVGAQGYGAHVSGFYNKDEGKYNYENVQAFGVCDLYNKRINKAVKHLGLSSSQGYQDYKKLLADKNIDAVIIATSDNWHAPIAIDAMNAGKNVYCEKPMCKTVEEAFAIYDTVKKTGKVFQIGSQGCTDPKWHLAKKAVADGKIGQVVMGQGSYMRNGREGEWNRYGEWDTTANPNAPKDSENYIDWNTFRKGALTAEFNPDVFFGWRKWFAVGSGLVGDLFPHRLHPLFIAMNLPTTGMDGFPVRVSSGGGLYVQKVHPDTGKMDRDVPDFTSVTTDFQTATLMAISSTVNDYGWQDCIRGNKATIFFGGNGIDIQPQRVWADEVEPFQAQAGEGENIPAHHRNWLKCIREGGVPNANIDLGVRVQVMISLAEKSYRENKTFTFDPKTRKYSA